MASTMDYVVCPQCEGVAANAVNFKTMEESLVCYRCGYLFEYFMICDTNENPILKDGKYQYETIEKKGFGVVEIRRFDGSIEKNSLHETLTEEQLNQWKKIFSEKDIVLSHSYLVSFENGRVKAFLGTPDEIALLSADDYFKEENNSEKENDFHKKDDFPYSDEEDLPF